VSIETVKRSHRDIRPARQSAPAIERARLVRRDEDGRPRADRLPPRLLRDAAREAGLFQRSVLGHLDHEAWVNRVRADGQRLADLLWEMGFSPSAERFDTVTKIRS
jgi:hypothetical protein